MSSGPAGALSMVAAAWATPVAPRAPRSRGDETVTSLVEFQGSLRQAVVLGEDLAVVPWLVGGANARKRLALHHRHYEASLVTSLLDRFPATVWLVGSAFVTEAARQFVRRRPPSRPCIAEYGEDFPVFLAAERGAATLPYLRSFAELEWHLGRLSLAVTLPALGQSDLSTLVPWKRDSLDKSRSAAPGWQGATTENIGHIRGRSNAASRDAPPGSYVTNHVSRGLDPDTLMNVRITLQPGVHYFHAAWDIDNLIRLFLTDSAPDQFSLQSGDAWIELRGARGDLQMNRLERASFAFRAALAAGQLLGDAAIAAIDLGPTFDAGQALATLVTDGLVTAIDVHHPGGTA